MWEITYERNIYISSNIIIIFTTNMIIILLWMLYSS